MPYPDYIDPSEMINSNINEYNSDVFIVSKKESGINTRNDSYLKVFESGNTEIFTLNKKLNF